MIRDVNSRFKGKNKERPVFLKAIAIILAIFFVISALPDLGPGTVKGQTTDYKASTKSALNELKGSLKDFGNKNLDTGLMGWINNWDGQTLPDVSDIKIKTAKGNFEIKDGKIVKGGKGKVESATNPDNVLIVVRPVKKGDWAGKVIPPKNPGDTIVILIDSKDIGDSYLKFLVVLFHELIHVKQFRAGAVYDKNTRGNMEVEAHAKTLPLLIELFKNNKDAKSRQELNELYEKINKLINKYAKQAKDKLKMLNDLLDAKEQIHAELKKEIKDLEADVKQLKDWIKELKEKLKRMAAEGLLDGIDDQTDEITKELQDLEKWLDDLINKLKSLESKNHYIITHLRILVQNMKKMQENEQKIKDATGKDKKELKKENKQLKNDNKKISKKIGKLIGEEAKMINGIKKLKDGKILPEIDKLLEKIKNILPDLEKPEHGELARELKEIKKALEDLKSDLELLNFKLKVKGNLEKTIKKRL